MTPDAATPGISDGPSEGLPAPETATVVIGQNSGNTVGSIVQLTADGLGLFDKYGVDVEFVNFDGAAQNAQALLAGQTDFALVSSGPVMGTIGTSSPLKIAFVFRDNLTDSLYVREGIESAEDLRGKAIAVSSFGSQSHAGALLAIKSLGLTDSDVTITPIGNDTSRLAALQGGSVDGSMQDYVQAPELAELGFEPLVELTEVEGLGGVPRTTLVASQEFMESNPNTVLAVVAALLEGTTEMRLQPDRAAEFLSEAAEISLEEATAEVDVELDAPWEPRDGRCNPDVMEFAHELLITAEPDLADIDPQEACTNEFLDQLEELGFHESIGVPGY